LKHKPKFLKLQLQKSKFLQLDNNIVVSLWTTITIGGSFFLIIQ